MFAHGIGYPLQFSHCSSPFVHHCTLSQRNARCLHLQWAMSRRHGDSVKCARQSHSLVEGEQCRFPFPVSAHCALPRSLRVLATRHGLVAGTVRVSLSARRLGPAYAKLPVATIDICLGPINLLRELRHAFMHILSYPHVVSILFPHGSNVEMDIKRHDILSFPQGVAEIQTRYLTYFRVLQKCRQSLLLRLLTINLTSPDQQQP